MIYNEYIVGMNQYIEKWKLLKKTDPELAREMAKQSLIETGVLDKDGKQKNQICNR